MRREAEAEEEEEDVSETKIDLLKGEEVPQSPSKNSYLKATLAEGYIFIRFVTVFSGVCNLA